jgi:hypothetical protein
VSLQRASPVQQRCFVLAVVGVVLGGGTSGTNGSDSRPTLPAREAPSKGRRPRLVLAVLLVAAVLAVAGVVTYAVTRPPALIDLKVTDGSMVGAIEGNLTSYGSLDALVLNFEATTYANETGGAASTLTLRLYTWTLFDSTCGCVVVNINATVVGTFASDLHPANLQLMANQTGPNGGLQSREVYQFGVNVSFAPGQYIAVFNGSGALSAAILGDAGKTYRFSYSDRFELDALPEYNRFVGFWVTVTGAFTPAADIGILLKIINVPGGIWA